jgi:hypothetical protein
MEFFILAVVGSSMFVIGAMIFSALTRDED